MPNGHNDTRKERHKDNTEENDGMNVQGEMEACARMGAEKKNNKKKQKKKKNEEA